MAAPSIALPAFWARARGFLRRMFAQNSRQGELAQASRRRLRRQPHLLHGYTRRLCRLPFQFRILAKKELWPIAFIGWYLDRSGQIPIDTRNPRATLSSLGVGVKALRSGMPLFVFPEGGRTPTGELQSFLSGAAYLAIRAQVPLVPIALSGVYDLLPMHTTPLVSRES
jgi:1-acyl-sn-glycerol-3-phosphate acyltransferase